MRRLDLGTNNCRLLVAEPRSGGFEVVDSFSRITRLGEGLAASERLSEPAMARTLAALKVCRRVMDRNEVIMTRCVATEACRRAANGAELIERVRRVTGIELEILGHDEEARLALLGCLPLIDEDAEQLLMVDIGGGSTEVMWLDRNRPFAGDRTGVSLSLPLGVVTLAESFDQDSGPEGYARMVDHTRALLQSRRSQRVGPPGLNGGRVQMLGTSGTVTTLAALHLGLDRYDRRKVDGVRITFSAINEVAQSLRDPRQWRARLAPLHRRRPGRSGGRRLRHPRRGSRELAGPSSLRVADRGVREGILNELMGHSLATGSPGRQSGRPIEPQPAQPAACRSQASAQLDALAGSVRSTIPMSRRQRRDGYRARSVYKLMELDERLGLLGAGSRVVDLGAAPGSWSQYARKKGAEIVAVDLLAGDADRGCQPCFEGDFLDTGRAGADQGAARRACRSRAERHRAGCGGPPDRRPAQGRGGRRGGACFRRRGSGCGRAVSCSSWSRGPSRR